MHWLYKMGFVVIAAALLLVTFTFAETVPSASHEEDIKNFTAIYVQAFNEHNADKLSSLWAPDAIYMNLSTHETLQGKNEIKNYFDEQFKDEKDSILELVIDSIKFDHEGKASEKGTAIVRSKNQPENKSFFLAELIPSNGFWVLQKVMELEDQPALSHEDQLKNLAWLIGKWDSKNEYADFSMNIDWDENKNFIVQNFTVTILDQKNLEGKQIIGWDPLNKKIRSWMIDSDGGFGEGFWRQQGDQWYVSMSFTLSDGRKASATHLYKKIDDDTFTFAAENRDIDGKILPDVKPFTIKKIGAEG